VVQGEVVCADRFGNLITNIDAASIAGFRTPRVQIANLDLELVHTYGSTSAGHALALVNAFGTLEIAVRNGNAAERLQLGPGAPVRVLTC
jgi:S-adenosyl-L-methionine hydrolase (adenosine-forming)